MNNLSAGDSGANWTTSSRLAYFTTHATSLVLFISYSATFISFLTVQHHHLPFSDFQGALDDGTYRVDVLAASADIDYFRVSHVYFVYHLMLLNQLYKFKSDYIVIVRAG